MVLLNISTMVNQRFGRSECAGSHVPSVSASVSVLLSVGIDNIQSSSTRHESFKFRYVSFPCEAWKHCCAIHLCNAQRTEESAHMDDCTQLICHHCKQQ